MGAATPLGQGTGHGGGQVAKLGARWRAGQGHGGARALAVEWLRRGCREPGHCRAQSRGGPGG